MRSAHTAFVFIAAAFWCVCAVRIIMYVNVFEWFIMGKQMNKCVIANEMHTSSIDYVWPDVNDSSGRPFCHDDAVN